MIIRLQELGKDVTDYISVWESVKTGYNLTEIYSTDYKDNSIKYGLAHY